MGALWQNGILMGLGEWCTGNLIVEVGGGGWQPGLNNYSGLVRHLGLEGNVSENGIKAGTDLREKEE